MQYLVIPKEGEPFYTKWFDFPDKYIDGSTVFDLVNHRYTTDGQTWKLIEFDHL